MAKKDEKLAEKQRAELEKVADGLMAAVRDNFDDAIAAFPKMPGTLVVNRGILISVGDAARLVEHLSNKKKSPKS